MIVQSKINKNLAYMIPYGSGIWCLTPLSTIFQLYRGGQVSFIDWGNRSTRRKPPTCRMSLTNFIT